MSILGSVSGILSVSQKQFLAKAQSAWKDLAVASQQAQQQAVGRTGNELLDMVDPKTREKLEAMRADADALQSKLSSGGESAKEAATRKADEAKRKLKALKLQAQLAAAAGDSKAAARIAREVAKVAKDLGQAAKDYGGGMGGGDAIAAAATAGASTGAAATAGATTPGEGTGQDGSPDQQAAASVETTTAAIAPSPAPSPDAATPTAAADQGGAGVGTDTGNITDRQAKGAEIRAQVDEKMKGIISEAAERKATADFHNDVRGTMVQLRAILDQMKKVARAEGDVGLAAQMEQAERDLSGGEQMLNDASAPGTVALPAGSLVQISA